MRLISAETAYFGTTTFVCSTFIFALQRRPRIRATVNSSNLLIVQNLISTERNGLSCSKITLLIVQKALIIVQF